MKKLLLDTHIFIWLVISPKRIPAEIYQACKSGENQLYISLVSAWEMQIKYQLGKLTLPKAPKILIEEECHGNQLSVLTIDMDHIAGLAQLPKHHNDPFDRLLISQAIKEKLTLATVDEKIVHYSDQVDLLCI